MSITMYTGRPGTGKTYSLVHETIKLLNKGEIVYCNFWIDWEGYEEKESLIKNILIKINLKKGYKKFDKRNLKSWSNLNQWKNITNGFIIMDEAHFYMNSRKWKDMDMEFMRKLAQHRKDGINIIGTVQNIKRVDVIVRELIDYWYDCKMFLGFVFCVEFDIDEDQMKKRPLSQKIIRFTKKRALRYDTLEKIGEQKI